VEAVEIVLTEQMGAPLTVSQIVAQWKVAPFKRGSTDCCAFADYVVWSLTGEHYLPVYSSDEEAQEICEKYGGLSGAVSHSMERPPVPREELSEGDVAYISHESMEGVGIVMGRRVATVVEDGRLVALPMRVVEHGWKTWA